MSAMDFMDRLYIDIDDIDIESNMLIVMLLGMVLELFTHPFSILLFILLSTNIIIMHLKKWSIKSEYVLSIFILLITMVLYIVVVIVSCNSSPW